MSDAPELYVEGNADKWSTINLLKRRGINVDVDPRPLNVKIPTRLDGRTEGVDAVLDAMKSAIRASGERAVGFVFDADTDVADRWGEIKKRLRDVGMNPPQDCPKGGYVEDRPGAPGRVGVWLMPEGGEVPGTLEDLIKTLISPDDRLFPYAEDATNKAKNHGASYPERLLLKAELHCWLAWQKEPGVPFGQAISHRILMDRSPVADSYLSWLGRLFGFRFSEPIR